MNIKMGSLIKMNSQIGLFFIILTQYMCDEYVSMSDSNLGSVPHSALIHSDFLTKNENRVERRHKTITVVYVHHSCYSNVTISWGRPRAQSYPTF